MEKPPFSWLGCPAHVIFFHSPCGHIVGCTGTEADLRAAQVSRATWQFERDLAKVLATGEFWYRSSSTYCIFAQDALDEISREFPYVTPESIESAKAAHQRDLDWRQALED